MHMQIALTGYGAMGQMVHRVAREKGFNITTIIDPQHPEADFKEINADSLQNTDVCIDFTHPDVAVENTRKIARAGKNIIMATTGWLDNLAEVKQIVAENQIGFLYASNFSLGVNLFYRILTQAAQLLNNHDVYDIYSYEMHHNRKKDAPSGTALSLGEILLRNIDRKDKLVFDRPEGKIQANELHLATIRGGDIPGTHVVGFDSAADTIELKHTARNRSGFALGSLVAAQWLHGKTGFFTAEDWMQG